MSIDGKKRAESKVNLPPNGGMFGPIPTVEQSQRRATQAFCKMLVRDKRRTQPGFVDWIERRAREECGDLLSIVETQIAKRRRQNEKLAASEERNRQL